MARRKTERETELTGWGGGRATVRAKTHDSQRRELEREDTEGEQKKY